MNNSENSIAPFRIGQIVTCVESHPNLPIVRKGNQFAILGIKMGCHGWVVDIGIESGNEIGIPLRCNQCGKTGIISDGIWWIGAFRFSTPKEQTFPSMTTKEIVKKELKLVSLN